MLGRIREQCHVAGSLERDTQLALMSGAGAGLPSRLDLGPLREVAAEAVDLLVVDLDGLVGAEGADLAATSVAVEVVALARPGGWHRSSGLLGSGLEGKLVDLGVVEAAARGAGCGSRAGRSTGEGALGGLALVEPEDRVGGDVEGQALLAVVGLVLAGPEAAVDEDAAAL